MKALWAATLWVMAQAQSTTTTGSATGTVGTGTAVTPTAGGPSHDYRLRFVEGTANVVAKDSGSLVPTVAFFAVQRCDSDAADASCVDVPPTAIAAANVQLDVVTQGAGWDPRADSNAITYAQNSELSVDGKTLFQTAVVALARPFNGGMEGAAYENALRVGDAVFQGPVGAAEVSATATVTLGDGVIDAGATVRTAAATVVIETVAQPDAVAVLTADATALEKVPVTLVLALTVGGVDAFPLAGTLRVTANDTVFTPVVVPYDAATMTTRPVSFSIEFPLAGAYDIVVAFERSDGINLTATQTWTIQPGLPRLFASHYQTKCIARVPFIVQPEFRLYMDTQSARLAPVTVEATFRLSVSLPDYTYTIDDRNSDYRNSWGSMTGMNNGENHTVVGRGGVFLAQGLGIDRAGEYEINAQLTIAGETFSANERIICYDMPSYAVPSSVTVNKPLRVVFHNYLHFGETAVVSMRSDKNCAGDEVAPPFRFPAKPAYNIAVYGDMTAAFEQGMPGALLSVTTEDTKDGVAWILYTEFIPYEPADDAYVCLALDSDPTRSVVLWQHYVQRHSEPVPITESFGISAQAACPAMTRKQEVEYRTAPLHSRWLGATEGRRYGCALEPPVNGSISPCACPLGQICVSYRAEQGNHTIDVGMCECCTGWLYAILFSVGTVIIVGTSLWIIRI